MSVLLKILIFKVTLKEIWMGIYTQVGVKYLLSIVFIFKTLLIIDIKKKRERKRREYIFIKQNDKTSIIFEGEKN